jgi:hypothetical protein
LEVVLLKHTGIQKLWFTHWPEPEALMHEQTCTVNVDFIRFKYVVLAKYLHMSIFEFYLLIKQHSLILCKNLLWLLF